MVKNHCLAKALSDAGWSKLDFMLTYKAESAGGEIVTTDRFYASTQLCCDCGNKQEMELSERTYTCKKCGSIKPRDLNSAINLLNEGLRIKNNTNTAGRAGINACGDLTSTTLSDDNLASRIVESGTICNSLHYHE
jgi:putative transposase